MREIETTTDPLTGREVWLHDDPTPTPKPKLYIITVNPESYETYETQNIVVLATSHAEAVALVLADIERQIATAPRKDYGEPVGAIIDDNWTGEHGFVPMYFTPDNVRDATVTEVDGPICYTLGVDG